MYLSTTSSALPAASNGIEFLRLLLRRVSALCSSASRGGRETEYFPRESSSKMVTTAAASGSAPAGTRYLSRTGASRGIFGGLASVGIGPRGGSTAFGGRAPRRLRSLTIVVHWLRA